MKEYINKLLAQADRLESLSQWHGINTDKGVECNLKAVRLYDKAERLSVVHAICI